MGYLREHAARYAETAGLRATLRFPSHPPDRPVSAELRRTVFLVLKEALHNVVKHAGATGVDVTLALDEASLTLIVADDGCGLAPEARRRASGDGAPPLAPARVRGGNGLGNMHARAEEIGGALALGPGETGGTVVHLRVPRRRGNLVQPPPTGGCREATGGVSQGERTLNRCVLLSVRRLSTPTPEAIGTGPERLEARVEILRVRSG